MEFQESIVEDLKSMGIEHSSISHSSDHFDMLLNLCTRMIEEGKFYADCTPEAQVECGAYSMLFFQKKKASVASCAQFPVLIRSFFSHR